jgi:hypothetical protein
MNGGFFSRIIFSVRMTSDKVDCQLKFPFPVRDFILGTHPITTKGTTQLGGGAKRQSAFDV